MSEPQFHETKAGRAFYERDVPAIARDLAALVKAVNRVADAVRGGWNDEPMPPPGWLAEREDQTERPE